ncbi:MAG: response regulator transcription factor [Lachnospiraceae bacterium]|nr:response regulator transcription factor [Lachnospiraceae bacterium]
MAKQILLVEDDDKIRGIIRDYFTAKSEGDFEILEAVSGEEGLHMATEESYDIVLLDVMLPGIDGFSLCRSIRKTSDVPILFLTARTREEDRLYGYELGCDDYICKPFSFAELYAKVNALLRRTKKAPSEDLVCGPITLNPMSLVLKVDGNEIELPTKEFEILSYFMQHKGWTVSRETLLTRIWGDYAYVETRVVDNHVKNLRKALGPAGELIKTVIGRGYKLTDPSDIA